MKVTLFATEAGAAHACELANGMMKYCDLTTVYHHKSAYGIDNIHPGLIGVEHIPVEGDAFILVGLALWNLFDRRILDNYKRVVVVIPDGPFMRKKDYFNKALKGYDVFTTNCKYQFADFPVKEYYQPFNIQIPVEKNRDLTIGHSVFVKAKEREKGSKEILRIARETGADVDFIHDLNWYDNLRRKAKCHIFVDQIDHFDAHVFGWNGGIGKSGLEAMLLDCLVLSWGKFEGRELPAPPIAWCDKDSFEDVLTYYIFHKKERDEKIAAQKEWALKYLNPDFCAKRILNIKP
jgi:hypothetical protein